jgi:peptide-methionine (R)-S-oxide reductase
MKSLTVTLIFISLLSCSQAQDKAAHTIPEAWQLSEEEWKSKLTDMEYYVLREKGTERAFTGEHWDNKESGEYICRACKLPLFSSETKFKSGTGWPSFYQPLVPENVLEEIDYKFGMVRTEVLCNRCGGHLGHVFPDGPKPTGQRYCLNSVSLTFIPKAVNTD